MIRRHLPAPGVPALALAAVFAAGGCRCGGVSDEDGGPGTDAIAAADAADAAPGTDAAGPGSDSALPPPQCLVGLVSDDAAPNLGPVFALLDAMPDVGWDHMPDNTVARFTENGAAVGAFDVIVWYQHNRLISGAEGTTMEAFLQAGGRLLVTGHDSLGDPDDAGLGALVRSSVIGDIVGVTGFTVTNGAHPIASGPFGAHGGETITTPTDDIDACEADVAAGAVTVAEYANGTDKIIATELASGGIVVYWNGNGENLVYDSPDWGAGQTAMREMLQNAVAWLCATGS